MLHGRPHRRGGHGHAAIVQAVPGYQTDKAGGYEVIQNKSAKERAVPFTILVYWFCPAVCPRGEWEPHAWRFSAPGGAATSWIKLPRLRRDQIARGGHKSFLFTLMRNLNKVEAWLDWNFGASIANVHRLAAFGSAGAGRAPDNKGLEAVFILHFIHVNVYMLSIFKFFTCSTKH
jgi:hypothetical protein